MKTKKIFLLCKLISVFALPLSQMFACTASAQPPKQELGTHPPHAENDAYMSSMGVYGVPWASDSLHNLDVGGDDQQSIAFRFRAQKTNRLDSVRLFWTDNRERPGYAKGNGGKIHIQVFTDSGNSKHEPSGAALASLIFEPNWVDGVDPQGPKGFFRLLRFSSPASLKEGELYHLTFTNIHNNPIDHYVGLDLNIVYGGESQPVIPALEFGVLVNSKGKGWRDASRDFAQKKPNTLTPIVSLNYADGTSQGSGYMEVWWQQPRQINKDRAVRESFSPAYEINALNSISVRVKRISGNGSLTIKLDKADGTQVAQTDIPSSSIRDDRHEWITAWFDEPIGLIAGQRYYLTLTSEDSTYEAYCIRDGESFGFGKGSVFADGHAEFNYGDGNGWQGWYGWSEEGGPDQVSGDLQFYFSTQPNINTYLPLVKR